MKCGLCETGFPLNEDGDHIPTQSLGMIPVTPCRNKKVPLDKSLTNSRVTTMKTWYYIAKRKLRGHRETYAGDGLVDADSAKEARQVVASRYGVSQKRIRLSIRHEN